MDTEVTINPDLSSLKQNYIHPFTKISHWKLEGFYQVGSVQSYIYNFCLVHHDYNIVSVSKGSKNIVRKTVMKLLCNDVNCSKDDGDISKLPNFKLRFQNYIAEFTP